MKYFEGRDVYVLEGAEEVLESRGSFLYNLSELAFGWRSVQVHLPRRHQARALHVNNLNFSKKTQGSFFTADHAQHYNILIK